MKWYTIIPTFVIAFILQLTVCSMITVNGIGPNLILCLVLIITFLFGNEHRCITCAVAAGLLLDIAVGKYTGVYALTLFLVGLGTVAYKHFFNAESKISVIPLAAAGTIAYHAISNVILALGGMNISMVKILAFLPIAVLWNLAIMYVMYLLMIRKATARPKRSRYERYEII